jgi:hypothetical protein
MCTGLSGRDLPSLHRVVKPLRLSEWGFDTIDFHLPGFSISQHLLALR